MDQPFKVCLKTAISLKGKISIKKESEPPIYDGDYTVTPDLNQQTLPTKEKYLLENVVINEIPYFEVGNNSGGQTVYIGKDI